MTEEEGGEEYAAFHQGVKGQQEAQVEEGLFYQPLVPMGDPSKAASLLTQRAVAGVLWLLWDASCFLFAGHVLVGLAELALPGAWFVLAWRARASSGDSSPVQADRVSGTRSLL